MRGFVFLGVCCLFEIGAGLSRVSMPPWVIACSSTRGAPTVFKCVWHVLDATLDQPAGNDEEPDMEMWIESNTFSSDDNFRSIVFFAKANGEYEQTKGHPGCWFEAHAIPSSGSSASMSFERVDVFVLTLVLKTT